MKLEYQAYDKTGRKVCSEIDASSPTEAMEKLCQQGLFVAELSPVAVSSSSPVKRLRLPRGRIRKLRELAMFTRQLYSLVHSGTPLAQGLYALEQQARDPRWRRVIADVRVSLERGFSLSEAMGAHPEYFDPVYKAMIAAGESSGKLTVILERMSALTRRRVHVLSTIRGAMIYPILLAIVGAGVFGMLLLFVIPRFAQLFLTIGAPLPPTTAALIAISEGFQAYWWAVVGGGAAVVLAGNMYLKSPAGKRAVDTIVLRVPRVGPVVKSFITARLARLLGLLIDSHLPIQDILRLTRSTTSNVHYGTLLDKAEEAVGRGEPVSSAFRDSSLIGPSVYEAIRSGEQSGQVSSLLLDLADFLDEENEITLKSLMSIVEPVLLVLMGLVVGFVVVSIFMPLFDVTGMMSEGGGR